MDRRRYVRGWERKLLLLISRSSKVIHLELLEAKKALNVILFNAFELSMQKC